MALGALIIIEGMDGVGKSTQCQLLAKILIKNGINVILFKPDSVEHSLEEILIDIQGGTIVIADEGMVFMNERQVEPDIIIILDCDPQIALKRFQNKICKKSDVTLDTLEKVRHNYKKLINPPKIVELDANGTIEETSKLILPFIEDVLGCYLDS